MYVSDFAGLWRSLTSKKTSIKLLENSKLKNKNININKLLGKKKMKKSI